MTIKKILTSSITILALVNIAIAKPIIIQHWKTANGTPVYFVAATQIPMVNIALAFDAGSNRDGDLPGLAALTAKMLDEGTAKLDANSIANQFDSLGVIYQTSTNQDLTTFTLRSLSKTDILTPAVNLFTQIVSEANFPDAAFLRDQRITLQKIAEKQQQIQDVADQVFYKTIYNNNPYGHPVLGVTDSVKKITSKDLQNFYGKYYVANNAMLAIVGDLTEQQAKILANTITEALPKGEKAPELKISPDNSVKTIDMPFPTTQTYIRIGMVGIKYNNPEYFPLIVANYTLGGGMTSRLFNIVREHYGLSYGIASGFIPLNYKGPFVIELQTKNAQTQQAITVTKDVLDKFVKEGPTEQELQAAKDFLVGSFPLKIASNADILKYLVTIGFYHLPLDYLDTYTKKINAVTLDQVNTSIKNTIKLEHMATVIVGDNKVKPLSLEASHQKV